MRLPLLNVDPVPGERELVDRTFDRLWPLCRSITGEGLRASLDILGELIPLERESIASGSKVFDWVVPDEWIIRGAYLADADGRKIVDFERTNLAVVNYSESVDRELSLEELQPHLHSIEDLPHATPYVTSYYKRTWGFCLSHAERAALRPGRYHAFIDAAHFPGQLDYADAVLPGESNREILLSSYLCHPSLANNELGGPLVLALLWQRLARWPRRRFSYRFVLGPETIGSLVYLSRLGDHLLGSLEAGYVLTCLGGPEEHLSFKHTRRDDALVDQLARHCEANELVGLRRREFVPDSGGDERQFCSPGFNLPVGQFARTLYGEYDGYHNSLDDKAFMDVDALLRSADQIEAFLQLYEHAGVFRNRAPYGEPQLGRRGLYPSLNSRATWASSSDDLDDQRAQLRGILYLLNFADGEHSALQIAERLGWRLDQLIPVIQTLEAADLLDPTPTSSS